MRRSSSIAVVLTVLSAGLLGAPQPRAQSVEDFYRGRTLTLIVSAGVGGGYDDYARVLAAHLSRHIPGAPAIVVQNMIGAGGLRAAQFLQNAAPRDGSVIGLVQSTAVLSPLIGTSDAGFDPLAFAWIGNLGREYSLCVSWQASKVRTVQDLFEREFVVGSSGAGTAMELYPHVLNKLLGTRIKVISGYSGGAPVLLAMERGEVDGRCGASLATYEAVRPEWIADHKINLLLQTGLEKDPKLPDTPWVMDYLKDARQKAVLELTMAPRLIDRPIVGPPGLPPARLLALQQALAATLHDPDFIREADARKLAISLMAPPDIRAFVERLAAMPGDIRAQAAQMLKGQ